MSAIVLIELDEEHLIQQTNDLYDRLKGYKCDLRPLPKIKYISLNDTHDDLIFQMGWNACLDAITGETE